MRRFARLLRQFWLFAEMLMHLAALLPYVMDPNRGQNYGIGLFAKLKLLWQLWRNSNQPGSSSTFFEPLLSKTAFGGRPFGQGKQPGGLTLVA